MIHLAVVGRVVGWWDVGCGRCETDNQKSLNRRQLPAVSHLCFPKDNGGLVGSSLALTVSVRHSSPSSDAETVILTRDH